MTFIEYFKKNIRVILISSLIFMVFVYYNIFALNLSYYFLHEKIKDRQMMIDLICDIADNDGNRESLTEIINEIDSYGDKGTYCELFDKDLNGLSDRTPHFSSFQFNPLVYSDFLRDVKINNRGKSELILNDKNIPDHVIYMYFRWIYRDTDEPLLIVIGVSKFSVETDIDGWLKTGAWLIAAAFSITGVISFIFSLTRNRGKKS